MFIVVTERAGNDSEGNWANDARERSDTGEMMGGEDERKRSQETLPFEWFLSG
jgi:hypothetical protein